MIFIGYKGYFSSKKTILIGYESYSTSEKRFS